MARLFPRGFRYIADLPPYIILIGDVGAGKSTIVEKVTGYMGRSSASDLSASRDCFIFYVPDGNFMICDTPGTNPIDEKFEHNVWIATYMNFAPISRILIVVRADTRIDKVIDDIRKYVEGFVEVVDLLGVCVTHMDLVDWKKERFLRLLDKELGLDKVVFSGKNIPKENVIAEMRESCLEEPREMTITDENFLRFFKISNNNIKILKCSKRELNEFKTIKKDFYDYLLEADENDQVDLIFEFQAWMKEEIIEAQKRVSRENNFTFSGANTANEAGHIANLTNQLRAELYDVRAMALGYQDQHGISQLRRCPHCRLVWAKLEGCDGKTTCGNRMDGLDGRKGTMGTFQFLRKKGRLTIQKLGERAIQRVWGRRGKQQKVGCGREIEWQAMATVPVPEEFCIAPAVTTDDVKVVPQKAAKTFHDTFYDTVSNVRLNIAGLRF